MVVNVCRNLDTGVEVIAYPLKEDWPGRLGVYNENVEKDLQTIKTILAPAIDGVLQECGGINIKSIIAAGWK